MEDSEKEARRWYLRCSGSQEPEVGSSLDAQEMLCIEFARQAGYCTDPAFVYRERGSGSDPTGPASQG